MTDYKYLIDVSDIGLEAAPSGDIVVYANQKGRGVIADLIPDFPIEWISFADLQPGWKTAVVRPANIASIEPKNIIGLCIALLEADCRIVVKDGQDYKRLETEQDIQQIRTLDRG